MYLFSYKFRNFLAFFAAAMLFCGTPAAQEESLVSDLDMGKVSYSWLSVLSGALAARPIKTSYGWMDFADGKMADAFTQSGQVLWQKGLPASATALAAVDRDDFAFVILRNKRLCLLNPSGLVLWQKPLDFEAAFAPLPLRDGRTLVFGKDCAACFGINGIQKWKAKLERLSSSLEPRQLDDGSVLAFLEAEEGSKSAALRVGPFGETIERIVFSGLVTGAFSVEGGVLLSFLDGSVGLCSASGGEAESKWLIKDLGLGQKVLFCKGGAAGKIVAASKVSGGTRVAVLDEKKAVLDAAFTVNEISSLESLDAILDGIFLAQGDSAALYSYSGKKIRLARFPPKTKKFNWDYVLFGSNGNITLTSRNWSVASWRFVKASQAAKGQGEKRKSFRHFYESQSKDYKRAQEAASKGRRARLEGGGYGEAEKVFLHDSDWILNDYFEKRMSQNSLGGSIGSAGGDELFSFSLAQETAAISMLSLFGSEDAAAKLSRVLNSAKDESVLVAALKSVQACGYDPRGLLMDSVEALFKSAQPGQEALLKELCEALYSICRFMGRPALYKKGLKILSNLQLPQYPASTKEEARKVYEKLAQLKL